MANVKKQKIAPKKVAVVQKQKKNVSKNRSITYNNYQYKQVQQQLPKNQKKKVKIRYGRILIAIVFFLLLFYFFSICYQAPIKNIIIKGNNFMTDQEIIDLAGLRDYPSNMQNSSSKIKKRLEKNTYIKKAIVTKNVFGKVTIAIEENYPVYYYQSTGKTILLDGQEVDSNYDVPFVINYIPNTIYEVFDEKMKGISRDVLSRISEIKYAPNEVDDGRFLLSMSDGNYVYLTLTRFSIIDHYIEIVSKSEFVGKKGILNLDAGNSFEILEG